jgi:leader peptidase (prepilin peptidase)/N-methyltransferase
VIIATMDVDLIPSVAGLPPECVVLLPAALLGGLVGAVTPRTVYRLAVPAGTAARTGCRRCGRPFRRGPAGWLRPGDRCPGCAARLGPGVWPLAAVGAVAFAVTTWRMSGDPQAAAHLTVVAVGLPLAGIDLACRRLPDPLVALAGGAALAAAIGAAVTTGGPAPLLAGLFGAAAAFAGHLLLALLPGSQLGAGDVKLAGVLGLLLGRLGGEVLLTGMLLAHVIAGAVAAALLLTGRARRRTALPLGPALLLGALLAPLVR